MTGLPFCSNACRQAAALSLLIVLAPGAVAAQETRLASGNWTRGLAGGWGHSWTAGVIGDGTTNSGVQFVAFHPQLGRFVTDHLEFYGEGTLLVYHRPSLAVAGGLASSAAGITSGTTARGRRISLGARD